MAPKAGSSTAESKGKSTANPSSKGESSNTAATNAQPSTAGNKLSKDEKELFIKCLKADQRVCKIQEKKIHAI
jgi:hypothetical protein